MNHYSPSFFADNLSEMRRGSIELGVPLLNDVIQIGAITPTVPGRIIVKKGFRNVQISRLDGEPLQAEVISALGVNMPRYERTRVFTTPVEAVELRRRRDLGGRACWFAAGDVDVTTRDAIETFAQTVGLYARLKQGKSLRT